MRKLYFILFAFFTNISFGQNTFPTYGSVGIGTTNPQALLDINGNVIISRDPSNLGVGTSNGYLRLYMDGASGNSGIGSNLYYDGTSWKYANVAGYGGKGMAMDMFSSVGIRFFASSNATNPATLTNVFQIGADGKIGIGTSNPLTKLDVNGRGRFISDNMNVAIQLDNGTTNVSHILYRTTTNDWYAGNESGFFTFYNTNAGYAMRIAPSGNVGIGTANPTNTLSIVKNQSSPTSVSVSNLGTVGANTIMQFLLSEDGSSTHGYFRRYRDGSGLTELGFTDNLAFATGVASTKAEKMRILSNGNIGIGTTNPIYKLDVNGTINVPQNTSINVGTLNGITNSYFGYGSSYRAITIGGSGAISLGVDLTTNTNSQFQGNEIIIPNNKAIIAPNDANNNYVGILRYNGEKLFLGGSNYQTLGHLVINTTTGSVGIGNNNPQTKLQIDVSTQNGSPTSALRLSAVGTAWANTGAALEFHNQDNGGVNLGAKIASLLQDGGANEQKTDLAFYTTLTGTNNEKMRITANGNIGIGTTSPTSPLHVVGNSTLQGSSTTNYVPTIFFKRSEGANMYSIGPKNATITNSPFDINSINGNPITFSTESVEKVSILNNGNVGIGTISPVYKFQIQSSVNNDIISEIRNNSTTGYGLRIKNNNDSQYSLAIQNAADNAQNVQLFGNGNAYFAGNVNLGASTIPAGYKLAVAGNVIAEKVKVKKSNTWPDFVFSPSYKLPNLTDVESFVKQNSHLPEIPSAAEIEKEGQDLGEMNRLLLKKVEELTLYLIEQNKNYEIQNRRIESQNSIIDSMQNEISFLKSKVK